MSRYTLAGLRRFLARALRFVARRVEPGAGATPVPGSVAAPSWLRDEALALSHIEPDLLPPGTTTDRFAYYALPLNPAPGHAYQALLDAIPEGRYTHVLMLPWLKPGGADRGAIYHVRALIEAQPEARILAIATEPADSPWKDKLPAGVPYVEMGKIAGHLDFSIQVTILTRALVQLQPDVVHNINSRVCWEAIMRHGLALTQRTRFFASLYCDDYDANMAPVGYARTYLRSCYPWLSQVFSDNSRYPRTWTAELGVPSESFRVLGFPYDRDVPALGPVSAPARPRVLWAGRLDRQKRPELLAAIVGRMPDVHFDVHGASVLAEGVDWVAELEKFPNLTFHGPFQRLEDIVGPDHVAYLHTSAWEGVPTILFDVAATGLPICAPDVGGIGDFVPHDLLITDTNNADAYVKRLRELAGSAELRHEVAAAMVAELRTHRSWATFVDAIRAVPGYLEPIDILGTKRVAL